MNTYELTLVLDGKSAAAKKKKVTESLEKVLKILKGEVKASKDWGVKDLAYKIGKSDTGLYLHFELDLEPNSVKGLTDKLKNDSDIIRHLLVRSDN
jgi:ribosomal protein S6